MVFLQSSPVRLKGHLQWNPSTRSTQVEAGGQAPGTQLLMFSSQWRPVKPGGQMHSYS